MINRLSQINSEAIKSNHEDLLQGAAKARRVLHVVLVLGLITAIGFATFMGRRMVGALIATTAAASAIARGDLDQDLPLTTRDELGELAATFNQMARELRRLRPLDADRLQPVSDRSNGDRQPARRRGVVRGAAQRRTGQ